MATMNDPEIGDLDSLDLREPDEMNDTISEEQLIKEMANFFPGEDDYQYMQGSIELGPVKMSFEFNKGTMNEEQFIDLLRGRALDVYTEILKLKPVADKLNR